jgi:hypothetical protein
MKKFGACLLWVVSWVMATMLVTAVLLYVLTRPSLRVVHTRKQPDTVSYQSFDPYCFSVAESDLDWRGFPLNVRRRCFIYIGVEAEQPAYGHMLDYSFQVDGRPLEEYLQQSAVEWTSDGVTFREASGHVLFVPKAMFIAGR